VRSTETPNNTNYWLRLLRFTSSQPLASTDKALLFIVTAQC